MISTPPVMFSTAQAQDCSTFHVPPLDGSMFINEMIDWHMKWNKDHQYAVVVGEGQEANGSVTYAQLGEAVYALGHHFLDIIPEGPGDADGKPHIVALLAGMDQLTYCTTIMALWRAGFQPFPLSPRNSAPALVHLMSSTSCHYLIGGIPSLTRPATALEITTQAILTQLESSKHSVHLIRPSRSVELFPHLHGTSLETEKRLLPSLRSLPSFSNATLDWPWLIIHSSGSTSFPKPIYISQRAGLPWVMWPWMGETDLADKVLGTMATPSFHAMGIAMQIGAPITSGTKASFFKPTEPPKIPTMSSFLDALIKSKSNFASTLPSFLEEWCNDPVAMGKLAQLDAIAYGAGPLSQEAGDKLIAAGVNLQNSYGTTEAGVIFRFFPKIPPGKDWQYGAFCPHLKPRLIPDEDGDVILQLMECDTYTPAMFNLPGERGYDTRDLLREHPTKKGYYKIVGRVDDQIMMGNGEKTNPGPLELIIEANPLVRGAMMFGRSRVQVGVAVEPVHPIDLSTTAELEKFRNAIWPSVEKANAFAPSHSRIFKEYILVLDPRKKPFPRTPKGAVQRKGALRDFEAEINAIYDEVDRAIQADWAKPPSTWDEEGLCAFISRVIDGTVGSGREKSSTVDPERDLFSQGCDSLQATYIRSALINTLRQAPQATSGAKKRELTSSIGTNFVFEHPTQKSIETYIVQLVFGSVDGAADPSSVAEQHAKAMLSMCGKYTADLPSHKPLAGLEPVRGEVVLITGTTGTLGTYLLARLLQSPQVSRVYALNRAGKGSLLQRQEEAFKDRGVEVSLLQNNKLRLVVGETPKKDLGISDELYKEIRDSITSIIHNAWRLDFNLSLISFEPHIQGVRNLVDLALASGHNIPPQILFTSSIGTVANWKHDKPIPEEPFDEPSFAVGGGYAEAKWVSERVLQTASKETGLRTTIFRIGQLSGSKVNGAWSITDWVPRIVQTGRILYMLPTFPQDPPVSWLPVDVAANTITDTIFAPVPGNRYLHVVNPIPARWNDLFQALASTLSGPQQPAIRLVPYTEWFVALEACLNEAGAIERIPALRFLDFFRSGVLMSSEPPTSYKEAMGMTSLETEKSKSISTSLRNAGGVDASDVLKWAEYWQNHGLFD